jgi:hypothetical protein
MTSVPRSVDEAVEALLRSCPEFGPAWRDLREFTEQDTAEDVGIYNVFCHILLPFLLYALDGTARFSGSAGPDWHVSGAGHRARFRDERQWCEIPARGDDKLDDLVVRLYEVLELWAVSPESRLRQAVYIEMVEAGYVDLTVEDLIRPAGPALRAMAVRQGPG